MSYKITKYPDGTSYVNVEDSKPVIFKINSYEDLFHLAQYADAFRSKNKFSPNILIPNLIDTQADKRFNEGESSGLKLVIDFINTMDFKSVIVFHPHNPEVVEIALKNAIILDNSKFIQSVLPTLNTDNLILMSSDAGGFKPLTKLCDVIGWKGETFSASKSRSWSEEDGSKFIQQIDRSDFGGKDILIIDDISVYGGTFKGLSKLLKERNVGKLYLAVSHITMEVLVNRDKEDDTPVTDYFDKVFTTNSKFDNYWVSNKKGEPKQPENLEIIKLFNYE